MFIDITVYAELHIMSNQEEFFFFNIPWLRTLVLKLGNPSTEVYIYFLIDYRYYC